MPTRSNLATHSTTVVVTNWVVPTRKPNAFPFTTLVNTATPCGSPPIMKALPSGAFGMNPQWKVKEVGGAPDTVEVGRAKTPAQFVNSVPVKSR